MGDSAGLCVACGLCCDGTIFRRAKTFPDEAAKIRGYGLDVDANDKYFAQPCSLLTGTACSIYAERFHACRTFRCAVLRRLDTGEIDRDRAGAIIAETKRLRHAAERLDPTIGTEAGRRRALAALADWTTRADPAERRHAAEVYLSAGALERFVAANFHRASKSPLAPDPGSGEAEQKGTA